MRRRYESACKSPQNCYAARHFSSVTRGAAQRGVEPLDQIGGHEASAPGPTRPTGRPPSRPLARSLTGSHSAAIDGAHDASATRAGSRRAGSPARGRRARRLDRAGERHRRAAPGGRGLLTRPRPPGARRRRSPRSRATSGAARARHVADVGRRDDAPGRRRARGRRAARAGRRRARS